MARNYVAIPFEYREEMDILTNEQFGELVRALMHYGEFGDANPLFGLTGMARAFAKRVMAQEDRFQKHYDELAEKRREAGAKGGKKTAQRKAEQRVASVTEEQIISSVPVMAASTLQEVCAEHTKNTVEIELDYSKTKQTQANASKTSYTETNTNTNTLTSNDEEYMHASVDASSVIQSYQKKMTLSKYAQMELGQFVKKIGTECCLKALETAQEKGILAWAYARGILKQKQEQGVTNLQQWEEVEQAWSARQNRPRYQSTACLGYRAPEQGAVSARECQNTDTVATYAAHVAQLRRLLATC